MTNEKALKALEQMKISVSPTQLEEMEYVIEIIKKLQKEGISNPLEADFSKINK